jgi:hypothetical protein
MGVKGLWDLLERARSEGTMEHARYRTLGVDVSLWLHQIIKGCRTSSVRFVVARVSASAFILHLIRDS